MIKAIVAVGGGEIRTRSTLAIDREIILLSGKQHPKLLFIPTASSDDEGYCRLARNYFGNFLKCRVDDLCLLKGSPSAQEIRRKIAGADIVYVGGGNTLMMMRLWRRRGVDKLLRAAYRRGCVLSGVSAGSICWFESGHSDSMSFYNPKKWKYINVRGLGLIPGIHCPHYNGSTGRVFRRKKFQEMIRKTGGIGIAIENNCAIAFSESSTGRAYRVIPSKRGARAFRVYKHRGEVVSEPIPELKKSAPLARLTQIRFGRSRATGTAETPPAFRNRAHSR